MAASLITATIQNNDLDPKDEVRFNWATNTGGLTAVQAQTFVDDFFKVDPGGAGTANEHALASCLTPGTVLNGVDIRVYDITGHLDGSPHGSPYVHTATTLDAVGGDSRGNQLVVVFGFHASSYGTTPVDGPTVATIPTTERAQDQGAPPQHTGVEKLQSRRSGRMYFGPVDGSIIGVDGNANPELTGTWKTNFPANLAAFLAEHPEWCSWSRRDLAVYPVSAGWVDFSIMTRRVKAFSGAGRGAWS